jgi:hypothetical protein
MGGFNGFVADADLRKEDIQWWGRNSQSILDDCEEHRRISTLSDAELGAELSEEQIQKGLKSQGWYRRDEAIKDYVYQKRKSACRWVATLAGLIVGFERIELESIHQEKSVQLARGQLRAFLAVMAVELGVAKLDESEEDDLTPPEG